MAGLEAEAVPIQLQQVLETHHLHLQLKALMADLVALQVLAVAAVVAVGLDQMQSLL
jgi:hypothetical protein